MSKRKFQVGDKVRRDNNNSTLALTSGTIYSVIDLDAGYIRVISDDRRSVLANAENFTLVEPAVDWEAKYNDLVTELTHTYTVNYLNRLESYDQIVRPLLPKPKQYDVTVRVGETDGRAARLSSPGSTFRGFPIQSVTEVTE
jgi:hypothetical protein